MVQLQTLLMIIVMAFITYEIIDNYNFSIRFITSTALKTTPKRYSYNNAFEKNSSQFTRPNLKKILFWNTFHGDPVFRFGYGQEPFLRVGCKINTCYTTPNREEFNLTEVDAVFWHFRSPDQSLPKIRSPHTRYVFFMMESPVHSYFEYIPLRGKFNWTFTYLLDSDVYAPYGYSKKLEYPKLSVPANFDYLEGKSKMAAWFVSHCGAPSARDKLVKELSSYIQIDTYGGCGTLSCGRQTHKDCMRKIEKEYKFHLSFENSLCFDYATERLFDPLQANIIPVVYGLAQYEKLTPPHSYIDIMDFNSTESLANYLIYLSNNPDKYNEYFAWKRYYNIYMLWDHSFCRLCEMLHDESLPNKVHPFVGEWFLVDRCWTGGIEVYKKRMKEHYDAKVKNGTIPKYLLTS